MALKLEQLERFRGLEPGDEEGLWKALETLLHCLDDHLVVVDEVHFEEGSLCRLTAFAAHDDSHTPLYAAVTDTGVGIVGRTDKLSIYQTQDLADFDSLWHEIVSLAVSERYRFVGNRLDLWIVARRFLKDRQQEPEIVAYHGLVWRGQDAEPKLNPPGTIRISARPQRSGHSPLTGCLSGCETGTSLAPLGSILSLSFPGAPIIYWGSTLWK